MLQQYIRTTAQTSSWLQSNSRCAHKCSFWANKCMKCFTWFRLPKFLPGITCQNYATSGFCVIAPISKRTWNIFRTIQPHMIEHFPVVNIKSRQFIFVAFMMQVSQWWLIQNKSNPDTFIASQTWNCWLLLLIRYRSKLPTPSILHKGFTCSICLCLWNWT